MIINIIFFYKTFVNIRPKEILGVLFYILYKLVKIAFKYCFTFSKNMEKWFKSVLKKIIENPIQNIFIFIVTIVIIYLLGVTLYNEFGIITAIGYIFACIYGITKIIDKLERAIIWAVGYIIGAIVIPLALENIIPIMKKADWASLIAILVMVYVIFMLYMKSRELKNY